MAFQQYILHQPENKRLLIISIIITAIQFIIFKYFYPYPNFMPPDSGSYIEAATNNQFINMWPIGYSKFLRLFSCFTNSHFILVLFQYLSIQIALLILLFTVNYFMPLTKWVLRTLFGISMLNPLIIHISNFVSSDALFTALSFGWFTQLIWIIYQPTQKLLLWHAVIILLAFMVRYNALYYPFISILCILLTRLTKRKKTIGICSIIILISAFFSRTQFEYQQQTNTVQFSSFSGWQLAANALYGYAYATPISEQNVPIRFKELHKSVNHHLDSLKTLQNRPDNEPGIYYLWNLKGPLVSYMNSRHKHDTTSSYFTRRAHMAQKYSDYGWYLIKSNPKEFIKHYVWPNFVKYYSPPVGFMGLYNRGENKIDPGTAKWFGWKNKMVYNRLNNNRIEITKYCSASTAVINILFLLSWTTFIYLNGIKQSIPFRNGIIYWMALIWFVNLIFSVWASPIELRYQIFPITITGIFTFLLTTWIIECGRSFSRDAINVKNSLIQPVN